MIGDKVKIRSRYNQIVSFEGYLLKKFRGGMPPDPPRTARAFGACNRLAMQGELKALLKLLRRAF
jgi:hypothetical protein